MAGGDSDGDHEIAELDAVHEFLQLVARHRTSGEVWSLADYQAAFPAHAAAIAREFAALTATAGIASDSIADASAANGPGGGPRRIGPYEIRCELGRGGQAVVFQAYDPRLRREVALKVLSVVSSRLDQQLRLRREAVVAGRLDDPGICPVYETGRDGEHVWLAMRYVEGRTLAAWIATSTAAGLPWRRVVGWFEQLLGSLQRAHAAGIVHRDLKPANVMIGSDERPVLLDFGLAVDESLQGDDPTLTRTGDRLGTPAYCSPEQLRGGGHGVAADLWAVAVSLYEALSATRPFTGPTLARLTTAILDERPPSLRRRRADVPRDLATVLEVALDKDPTRRYRTAEAFAADLAAVAAGRPIDARPPSPWRRVVYWQRRHAVAATALWALSVGGAFVAERSLANARLAASLATTVREFDLLAGVVRLRRTTARAESLYPAVPSSAPDLEACLRDDAVPLLAMREPVDAAIASLENRRGEQDVSESQAFLRDALVELRRDLQQFADSTVPSLERRLRWARAIGGLSAAHPLARHGWGEVRAAIAAADDVRASTAYRQRPPALRDEDVVGLVPIGCNPVTRLWEFYDLRSAWDGDVDPAAIPIPEHGADGGIAVTEATGVVFVLVPGGRFRMGESEAQRGTGFRDSFPEHDVTLAPFLLARHELTQAQWRRLWNGASDRAVPSKYLASQRRADCTIGWTHPVEQVAFGECARLCREHGFALPTEAQWEYACRAGTNGPFWCAPPALVRVANLADAAAARIAQWPRFEAWDDGYSLHAPVGSFAANPFGLHDVHGNVEEWCRDGYALYTTPVAGPEGLRMAEASQFGRVLRGGTFHQTSPMAHSASRAFGTESTVSGAIGVRLARTLPGELSR